MKTITFVSLCIALAVVCFLAGYQTRKVGELQRGYDQATQYPIESLQKALRSYQVQIYDNDSSTLFDADRRVGVLLFDSTSQLDKLITMDNQ